MTEALGYDALAPGGTLIIVLDDVIPAKKKAGDNKRVLQSHGAVHWPQNRAIGAEFFKRLSEWLRTGVIVVRVGLLLVIISDGIVYVLTRQYLL